MPKALLGGNMFTKRLVASVAVLVLAFSMLAPTRAAADIGSASFSYLAGTGFLCGFGAGACPDVARAENGDTVSIAGSGAISVHPKSADGSGTFVHKNAGGTILASGTWNATALLSFVDYGSGTGGFAAPLHAGEALIAVDLLVRGTLVHTGILTVTCRLPGAGGPSEMAKEEGVRLVVQGGLNFNKKVSGFTVFVEKP